MFTHKSEQMGIPIVVLLGSVYLSDQDSSPLHGEESVAMVKKVRVT